MKFRPAWLVAAAIAIPALVGGTLIVVRPQRDLERIDVAITPSAPPAAGHDEIAALAEAYPDRVTATDVRGDEWALELGSTWYLWAGGRLLPPEDVADAAAYVQIRFYNYELGPLDPIVVLPEQAASLERRAAQTDSTDTRLRFNGFLDALYGISSQRDADAVMERVEFLGHPTRVHPLLVVPLRQVEREILVRSEADAEVRDFVSELASVHGYNWRTIAGTVRRSYHSYGVAVDLVPRSYGGLWPYWLWAEQAGIQKWWEIPLSGRWHVPQTVIDAFESNGFIWGGKWLYFDTLHFEYRPESILLAQRRMPT